MHNGPCAVAPFHEAAARPRPAGALAPRRPDDGGCDRRASTFHLTRCPLSAHPTATPDDPTTRVLAAIEAAAGTGARLGAVAPMPGGACQENLRVDVEILDGPDAGAHRLVLRSDATSSLPGSLGRADEFAVIAAARRAGAPTPRARWLTPDLLRPGAHAYFLDFAAGVAIGAKVVRSPALAPARERFCEDVAAALAAIHRVTPAGEPGLDLSASGWHAHASANPQDHATGALAFLDDMLATMRRRRPAIELGLRWLAANAPPPAETTLVHGDYRVGNFLFTPDGLEAVLDWEFAHWGDPLEDVAWLCVRDWRFGRVDRPAGGVATRADFYAAYAAASGRPVDPRRVHFWEVFGNLRWAAGAIWQGERYLSGAEADLELCAIPRRAAEMEYEALRLIATTPTEDLA